MELLWYIGIGILTGLAAGEIASQKGLGQGRWFVAGFLFNLFGVLLAVVAQPEENAGHTQECPQCAEIVKWKAAKCRYCGSQLR